MRHLMGRGYRLDPWINFLMSDRPFGRFDRFVPFGGAERRLKTLLIDAKVPRWDRSRVPVIEAGGVIIWIGHLRRSATARVTARTRRVLELALVPLAKTDCGR